jgi:signal transduction histidine kinase
MGAIFIVHMYLINRAQKDLLKEIDCISASINQATDSYYARILKTIKENEVIEGNDHDVLVKSSSTADSLYKNVASQLRNFRWKAPQQPIKPYVIYKDSDLIVINKNEIKNDKISALSEEYMHELIKTKSSINKELERELKDFKNYYEDIEFEKRFKFEVSDDSLILHVETIDIDLNVPGKNFTSPVIRLKNKKVVKPPPESRFFTFRVPDLSLPHTPKILRYNYNLSEFKQAFVKTRNKNMLITLGLFMVSIAAISIISRRFLRPIDKLKTSFEQVVDGNLDISIAMGNKDEIGELTSAFNKMVTELKKNKEKEKILQQKERLASMGQLSAGVAHEIKNPLNAINLTITHLKDKYGDDDKVIRQYTETIQSEIHRLNKIVDNFLNFIRSENLNKEEIDMNDLIFSVLQLFEREIKVQKIKLMTNFPSKCILSVDRERFKTVLMNLILNAIQAMPDGGELKLSTDSQQSRIHITDSGHGISKGELEKVFDFFYTSKSKGTGLGLPTAYKIVKEHGGNISIQSELKKGTKVIIDL